MPLIGNWLFLYVTLAVSLGFSCYAHIGAPDWRRRADTRFLSDSLRGRRKQRLSFAAS